MKSEWKVWVGVRQRGVLDVYLRNTHVATLKYNSKSPYDSIRIVWRADFREFKIWEDLKHLYEVVIEIDRALYFGRLGS